MSEDSKIILWAVVMLVALVGAFWIYAKTFKGGRFD